MVSELTKKVEFLQIVLNNIPSFAFWKDTESVYQGCNLNFAKSAGLQSADDILGKTDYDLPWSKEESEYFRKIDREVMAEGKAKINFEEPQTISDGTTKWIRTSKIPLRNSEGTVIGILGIYEDITERKNMEIELFSSNKNLKELNSKLELVNLDLEQFAYATSHDLKEPIRMIGGFAGLLKKKYSDILNEEGKEYLDYITEGATRMVNLVSQILTYAKVENVKGQFISSNLTDLVKEALVELELMIKERNVAIRLDLPEQDILCQPLRIRTLIYNLVLNGIKFNTSSSPEINITYEEKEDEWKFHVSDNGIGIEEEYVDLVFKPFKRLNQRNNFPGSGIGLSICKRIVNLHGGEITFKKNEPKGTTFSFTITKNVAALNEV